MQPLQEGVTSCPVYIFDGREFSKTDVDIIQEISLQVFFNERHLATIACTGIHLDELAVGYLKSEGLLEGRADIRDIHVDTKAGLVHVFTNKDMAQEPAQDSFKGNIASSGARSRLKAGQSDRGRPTIRVPMQMSPHAVLQWMNSFIELCRLHARTRGTHGAALVDGSGILVVREDIGRHNAIDMLAGYALMHTWNCSEKAVLRTGRVSSEIVYKLWNLGIPVVVSLAAPTACAIALADEAGITLIGAIRGSSMQVYTHERRMGL
jgi:FdhD protein